MPNFNYLCGFCLALITTCMPRLDRVLGDGHKDSLLAPPSSWSDIALA